MTVWGEFWIIKSYACSILTSSCWIFSLELVVEPWIENLWPELHKLLDVEATIPAESDPKGAAVSRSLALADRVKEISKRLAIAPKTEKDIDELTGKLGGLKIQAGSPIFGIGKGKVESELTIPAPPARFLEVAYDKNAAAVEAIQLKSGKLPSADTDVFEVDLVRTEKIVEDDALKRTYRTVLDLKVRDTIPINCFDEENAG